MRTTRYVLSQFYSVLFLPAEKSAAKGCAGRTVLSLQPLTALHRLEEPSDGPRTSIISVYVTVIQGEHLKY